MRVNRRVSKSSANPCSYLLNGIFLMSRKYKSHKRVNISTILSRFACGNYKRLFYRTPNPGGLDRSEAGTS